HHLHRPVVDADRLADDVWVAAEAPLPERPGQEDRFRRALALVGRGEEPAGRGVDAEQREEVARDEADADELRLARVGARDAGRPDRPEAFERGGARAQVDELRPGQRDPGPARRVRVGPDEHEPRGLAERGRREERRVDDTEDGRDRADAERERRDRHQRKARRLPEAPPGLADVGEGRLPERHQPGLADRALHLVVDAHLAPRRPPRVFGREAFALVAGDELVEVAAQLRVELVVHPRAVDHPAPQATEPRDRSRHRLWAYDSSTWAIAPT